jgi:sugar lactone lactonase YvrE
MRRFVPMALGACLFALSVAACSGSSTSTTPTPQLLYFVTDANSNALTAYPLNASGNVTPSRNIAGAATGLGFPRRIVIDATGSLYVANAPGAAMPHSITVYAAAANGNAAPIRTIMGGNTGLTGVNGLALDNTGTNLYAANCGACFDSSGSDGILIFPAGTTGNVAPSSTIAGGNTGLSGPTGITFDAAGNLLVANSGTSSVTTYAPGASGNIAPTATLVGGNTGITGAECVRTDAASLIYVCNTGNNSITVYTAGANGNIAPTRTLMGASTGLLGPTSVSFDPAGNMYVANSGANTLTVYAPGATGNQAPMLTVAGASTGLVTPIGIAIQF